MEFHMKIKSNIKKSDARCSMLDARRVSSIQYPESRIRYFAFCILIFHISLAQPAATSPEESAAVKDANAAITLSFPYVAEITANDVNIRSGPGTNYYGCGKLNKGDRVEVVSEQFGWSRIVPPAGSFSWISMQYISVNLDNPAIGTVTGDNVRVYAGSDYVEPMHSTSEQARLKRGDKVKLLGEEKDDYYKIAPPSAAYIWVSTQYTKPAAPVIQTPLPAPQTADANLALSKVEGTVIPEEKEISVEAEKLKEYYDLKKQIEAERAKPINQQNYTDIKKQLAEIANNKNAGNAARYAQFVTGQIEGFEVALAVSKEVQLQNEQLKQIMERIDKARATKLAKTQDLGRFVVVGQFQTFKTYGPGHYRIIDDSGKTVCYAKPSEQTSQVDLSKFIGRKVGLVGEIEPHPQTAGALVQFTEVVELKGES